jgi:hypothetical protein
MTTDSVSFRGICDRDGCSGVAWWTATRNEGGGPEDPRILYRIRCGKRGCTTPADGNEATPDGVEPVTASRLPEYFTRILGRRAS